MHQFLFVFIKSPSDCFTIFVSRSSFLYQFLYLKKNLLSPSVHHLCKWYVYKGYMSFVKVFRALTQYLNSCKRRQCSIGTGLFPVPKLRFGFTALGYSKHAGNNGFSNKFLFKYVTVYCMCFTWGRGLTYWVSWTIKEWCGNKNLHLCCLPQKEYDIFE